MPRLLVIATVAALACGCAPPGPGTPEGALAALSTCLDRRDARCLVDNLDRDSRWSLATVHKLLGETRTLVERSYPAAQRATAYGAWSFGATAATPTELFARFCEARRCLETLAGQIGAPVNVQARGGPDELEVETTRGARLVLRRSEGRFGLATWRTELEQAKLHLQDNLAEVRRNAATFDEQRRAGVPLGPVKGTP